MDKLKLLMLTNILILCIDRKLANLKGEIMKILAKGNSMYPTLIDGKYYEVDIDTDDYKINDIIVFINNGQCICHRIINIIETRNKMIFYKTKGDNCCDKDSFAVTRDSIIGIVKC